jgi:hypothetical protein
MKKEGKYFWVLYSARWFAVGNKMKYANDKLSSKEGWRGRCFYEIAVVRDGKLLIISRTA